MTSEEACELQIYLQMRKKKGLFFENSLASLELQTLRFANKVITAKQNSLQQLHIHKNHSFNASLLIRDTHYWLFLSKIAKISFVCCYFTQL